MPSAPVSACPHKAAQKEGVGIIGKVIEQLVGLRAELQDMHAAIFRIGLISPTQFKKAFLDCPDQKILVARL